MDQSLKRKQNNSLKIMGKKYRQKHIEVKDELNKNQKQLLSYYNNLKSKFFFNKNNYQYKHFIERYRGYLPKEKVKTFKRCL